VIRNKIVENIPRFSKLPLNQVFEFTVRPREGVKVGWLVLLLALLRQLFTVEAAVLLALNQTTALTFHKRYFTHTKKSI